MTIHIKFSNIWWLETRSLIVNYPTFFHYTFTCIGYISDLHSINNFCKVALLSLYEEKWQSTKASLIEIYPMENCVYSVADMESFVFFLAIVRRRTIPHADQLRVVSTARYWLSHGKAWHVLRWRVRFLIRVVLDLTNRFDFSVRLLSYISHRTVQHTNSSNILTPSLIILNTDQTDGKGKLLLGSTLFEQGNPSLALWLIKASLAVIRLIFFLGQEGVLPVLGRHLPKGVPLSVSWCRNFASRSIWKGREMT